MGWRSVQGVIRARTFRCWLRKDKREKVAPNTAAGSDPFSFRLAFLSLDPGGFFPWDLWERPAACSSYMYQSARRGRLQTRENKIKPNFRSNWLKLGGSSGIPRGANRSSFFFIHLFLRIHTSFSIPFDSRFAPNSVPTEENPVGERHGLFSKR